MKPKKPRIIPEHLSEHVRPVIHVYQALEEELFMMMAKRLSQGIPEDPNDILWWQADKLQQIGLLDRQTVRELSKATGQAEKAIRKALEEVGYKTIESVDYELSDVYKPRPVPSQIDAIMEGYVNQTFRELDNFVNQTLITTSQGTGSVARTYQRIVEESTGKVLAGVSTVRKAIAETVINWADRGIASGFTDRGGRTWSMEAYARTVIRSTANRTYNELRMSRMKEYDVHLVVMSSLPSARPACAPIQGKVVSTEREPRDSQYPSIYDYGYGEPWGVRGINCRHMFFPFIEGVNINNQPQFDESEVNDRYKLTQKQRYYERQIRKAKKSLALAKEVGDIDTINRYKRLVSNRQARLRNFISANDLARHRGREQIYAAGIKDSLKTKVKTLKVKSNNVPSPDQITKILREKDIFEKYDPTKHGEVTQALYDALGLAGKPTVVKKIPSNYQLQLRGIPSDDKYKIFKQLKEGDMWSSAGTSGNGINLGYGTGDRESNKVTIPAQFATRGGSTHGIVATAALTPDAKRISFEKLDELIEDFKTSRIKKELIEILEEKANAIKPFSIPDRSEAERAFKKKEYYLTLANLVRTNERSVVALVNGYDAIDSNFWTETTVINRTKLIIEEDAIEITPENSKEVINMLFAKLGIKR